MIKGSCYKESEAGWVRIYHTESMFWVITHSSLPSRASSARARWPSFGAAARKAGYSSAPRDASRKPERLHQAGAAPKMLRMKRPLLLCVSLVLLAYAAAADDRGRIYFPKNGFSIQLLEGKATDRLSTVVTMLLPPSGNFAANVNVQVQPYHGTLADYADLSLDQFREAGLQVIRSERTGEGAAIFEYTGTWGGYDLHWYSTAVKAGNAVYLATATALSSEWETLSKQLIECVSSFRIEH